MIVSRSVTTPRLPDWQARLGALLETRSRKPFEWGLHDCCLFAADAVHATVGVDPAADLRTYSDAKGAAKVLQTLGGVAKIGDDHLGAVQPVLMARVGDTGLVQIDGRDCLAVCNGDTWLGPGEDGLVALPLRAAIRAWRY